MLTQQNLIINMKQKKQMFFIKFIHITNVTNLKNIMIKPELNKLTQKRKQQQKDMINLYINYTILCDCDDDDEIKHFFCCNFKSRPKP